MAGTPDLSNKVDEGSFFDQVKTFTGIYWVCNWMELVERFAYYGVRVVLPVFMVEAIGIGGPEFDHIQKGKIYASWALVQSFVPIFSGGFADRYGYKLNIAISTAIKILGYLLMGYCIVLAEGLCGMPLAEARPQGLDSTYEIFYLGAMFLALGTAIFKPGVQGLIANQLRGRGASLGWGLFYQMVNIGGFLGPFFAAYLQILKWEYVFLLCTAGIALNFIPLFFFAEPDHGDGGNEDTPMVLIRKAVTGLTEPRLFFFTVCFAGFWLMFYQFFDILPNFITDWVDSRDAAAMLVGTFGEAAVPTVDGGNLTQAWIINLNALVISCVCFIFAYITGKVRALMAIFIGIAISAVAIYGLGMSLSGWWIFGCIALFSVGEMCASPTKMRYLASITPPGKEGQYMGYANMTVGIGWSIGSLLAGFLYQGGGDKVVLARRYLVEQAGVAADKVAAIEKADLLPFFEQTVGVDAWETRQLLWNTYEPGSMWLIFALIGIGSMGLLFIYDRIVTAANENPAHSFNTKSRLWVRVGSGLILLVFAYGVYTTWAGALVVLGSLFLAIFFGTYSKDAIEAENAAIAFANAPEAIADETDSSEET